MKKNLPETMKTLQSAKLTILGGKGGVGKTSLSAALALYYAREGRQAEKNKKILLISTDPAHNLSDLIGKKAGDRPTKVERGLDAMELDPEHETSEYVKRIQLVMKGMVHPDSYRAINEYLKGIAGSPGAQESAILDALTTLLPKYIQKYDRIILDTAPSGHTLRLMTLPGVMMNWAFALMQNRRKTTDKTNVWGAKENQPAEAKSEKTGEIPDRITNALVEKKERFERLAQLFHDGSQTVFLIVMNPDYLSFHETTRVRKSLHEAKIQTGVIVNRIWPQVESESFAHLLETQKEILQKTQKQFRQSIVAEIPLVGKPIQHWNDLPLLFPYLSSFLPGPGATDKENS